MARVTNLVKKLEARGLVVEYVKGWSTRGASSFTPKGVMCHWTAGPRGTKGRPSLNVVTNGRPGLPGPLCNVYLDRRGVAVIVAAGRANHGGRGQWKSGAGNSDFFGIEAEAADGNDWTQAQRDAYPKLCAGLLDAINEDDSSWVCGHSEYALPKGRKIDVNGYPMTSMRSQVHAIIKGQKPATPKPKPKPSRPEAKPKELVQSKANRPNGSTKFPTDFEDLAITKKGDELTVGALQILLHATGRRDNQLWDGDFAGRTIADSMRMLRAQGYYKVTPFAAKGVAKGVPLKVDRKAGYWFWVELQRFLADARGKRGRKFYTGKIDGDFKAMSWEAFQCWLNTQNGR